jgi:hypothetical protein
MTLAVSASTDVSIDSRSSGFFTFSLSFFAFMPPPVITSFVTGAYQTNETIGDVNQRCQALYVLVKETP